MLYENERRIIQAFVAFVRAWNPPAAVLRELLVAISAESGSALVLSGAAGILEESAREPTIHDILSSEFKNQPYADVGRGCLRDGIGGPKVRDWKLPGSTGLVLAHLLLHGKIHAAEVLAYQVENGLGTVYDRLENARTTISKTNGAIKGLGVELPRRHGSERHSTEWVLKRNGDAPAVFSVDIAKDVAKRAQQAMDEARFDEAASTAIEAVRQDDLVLHAHEVLCQAALGIGPGKFHNLKELERSVKALENRVEHLVRCLQIIDRSLPEVRDDEYWVALPAIAEEFKAERDRLNGLTTKVKAEFGHLFDPLSPADRQANELVKQLRDLHLGVDQVLSNALGRHLLGNWRVNMLRDQSEARLPASSETQDRQAERSWVNAIFMMVALDPAKRPDIRSICKTAEYEIVEAQESTDGRHSSEARWALQWNRAKELFYTVYGIQLLDEELAAMLRWPWSRVTQIRDWKSVQAAGGSDSLEWLSGEEDTDPGHDPDEDLQPNGRIASDDEEPVDERAELSEEDLPDERDADEYCKDREDEDKGKCGPERDTTPPEKTLDDDDEAAGGCPV